MPRVPTYDTRVREQPLPQADLPRPPIPEAFGYAAGRGLQNLAADVNDVQLRARRSADLDRLIDLERQLGEIEHGMEHGDAGWRKRRGADARGIGVQYGDEFKKAAEGLGQDLQSAEVKRAWERLRASREFAVRSQVETWEGQETEQASRDGLSALLKVNTARAATAPDLPKLEAASAANARALTAYGLEHGWTPEQFQAARLGADSEMAGQALLAWPAEDPTGKRAFLTRWGDALDPRDKAAAIKGVAKVEREAGVLADARAAWEKSGQDYGDATKLADEITAGKPAEYVQDVQAYLEDFRLREVRAKDEDERDWTDRASQEFSAVDYRYAGLSAKTVEDGAKYPDKLASFRDLERRIHKAETLEWSDVDPKTSREYGEWLLLPVEERARTNPMKFLGSIPRDEAFEAIKKYSREKEALADESQAAAKAAEIQSIDEYVKERAQGTKILKKNGKPSGNGDAWRAFHTAANRELLAAQTALTPGQRLSRDAMEKIVDGLLIQGRVIGPETFLWRKERRTGRAFELPGGPVEGQAFEPDERGAVPYFPGVGADDLSDIPPAALDEILAIDPDLPSSEIRRIYNESREKAK